MAETRRQHKKFKIFDESGLTDADRREIRSQQRSLQERMVSGEIGWELGRTENNNIFATKVAYSRELVIDVENSTIALNGFAKEVESKVQVPRFDAMKLIDKLSQQAGTTSGFNWAELGRAAGVCFCAVPSGLSFLAGALDSEVRQRAKPKKRTKQTDKSDEPKEKIEETRPEEVTNNKSDGDKLSAMEKLNKKVKARLESRTNEDAQRNQDGGTPQLDAVRFLFNPKSFTQTVENIFTYSFLVKKGHGGIGVREDENGGKSLFVQLTGQGTPPSPRQSVCSFTMADFRRLIDGVEQFDLPNRSSRLT